MNANRLTGDIDEVLRDYYRTEMPEPFPACPTPRRSSVPSRSWHLARWAVAASVALLLAGYLALAGFFPRESSRLDNDGRHIGQKHRLPAANP